MLSITPPLWLSTEMPPARHGGVEDAEGGGQAEAAVDHPQAVGADEADAPAGRHLLHLGGQAPPLLAELAEAPGLHHHPPHPLAAALLHDLGDDRPPGSAAPPGRPARGCRPRSGRWAGRRPCRPSAPPRRPSPRSRRPAGSCEIRPAQVVERVGDPHHRHRLRLEEAPHPLLPRSCSRHPRPTRGRAWIRAAGPPGRPVGQPGAASPPCSRWPACCGPPAPRWRGGRASCRRRKAATSPGQRPVCARSTQEIALGMAASRSPARVSTMPAHPRPPDGGVGAPPQVDAADQGQAPQPRVAPPAPGAPGCRGGPPGRPPPTAPPPGRPGCRWSPSCRGGPPSGRGGAGRRRRGPPAAAPPAWRPAPSPPGSARAHSASARASTSATAAAGCSRCQARASASMPPRLAP